MTAMMTNVDQPNVGIVVRPNNGISTVVESQRAIAEVQAALTVAAARPRDEKRAIERIEVACERVGLAEKAEYSYSRGGQEITGPTIDLLTVIANCWGNLQFGFRELAQRNGESDIEAFAWDLETNSKRSVQFTLPHKRHTRSGSTTLTDPRDIYEMVANNAQRRVRACLEAVIPPDVVEDAVMKTRATLQVTAEVNDDSITKLLAAFEKFGINKMQIEARLQRRIDTMQPAQLVSLRRIYRSMQDGMSIPQDWFPSAEAPQEPAPTTAAATVKEQLKKKAKAAEPEAATSAVTPDDQQPDAPSPQDDAAMLREVTLSDWSDLFAQADSILGVEKLQGELTQRASKLELLAQLNDLANGATARIRSKRGTASNGH